MYFLTKTFLRLLQGGVMNHIIAAPYFLDHHLMLSGGRRRECKKIVEEEENAGIYDGISSKNRLNNSKNIKNTY